MTSSYRHLPWTYTLIALTSTPQIHTKLPGTTPLPMGTPTWSEPTWLGFPTQTGWPDCRITGHEPRSRVGKGSRMAATSWHSNGAMPTTSIFGAIICHYYYAGKTHICTVFTKYLPRRNLMFCCSLLYLDPKGCKLFAFGRPPACEKPWRKILVNHETSLEIPLVSMSGLQMMGAK